MALVYEAANGASLDTVRVRGFFTYDGFMTSLLGRMQTIAETLQKENWVLGASGDQAAVKQQYVSLFPGILALYSKDFISEWMRGAEQSAAEVTARRQAKICEPRSRFRADLADQTALRIRSGRDAL